MEENREISGSNEEKEMCSLSWEEELWGKSKGVKEDFEEEPSAKYILFSSASGVENVSFECVVPRGACLKVDK